MKTKITVKPGSTESNKTGGWRTFKPHYDESKCIGCGLCEKICPDMAISMVEKNGKKKIKIDYDFCKGCGLCAAECPMKCITMKLDKK